MRFVVAGATGFLGTAWCEQLRRDGHDVFRLVRRPPTRPDESPWDPAAGRVDHALLASADVVANLAGAPLAHWPWTDSYKQEFLHSRTDTTHLLAEHVAQAHRAGEGPVLLVQNGLAGYGDRGAELITEDTPSDGETFIAEVTRQWQAAATPALEAGARVVVMRSGVVLHRSGGALKSMLPAFKLGAGGPIGSGEQYFSTISLDDWLAAATYLALSPTCTGAYNITAPDPHTNGEFTVALGRALHRPTFLKLPALPLRKLGGVAGGELLSSARVQPARLLAEGFEFAHPTLAAQLDAALH